MEVFKSNKYIRDYLKHFTVDKHHQLIENILIIGIDFIKKIYDNSEILQKVKKIASNFQKISPLLIFFYSQSKDNITNTQHSANSLQDSIIKDDIMKIQQEISKLNNKFENEMTSCQCKKLPPHQKKPNPPPTEKKEKKPFKIYNLSKTDSQNKLLNYSVTPKVWN